MENRLDWSHAYTNRLKESSFSSSSYAYQAPRLAARLQKCLNERSLPFLSLSFAESLSKELPPLLEHFARFRHLILLGIGGSALGAKALQKAFSPGQDWPAWQGRSLWIADNVDPSALSAWLNLCAPEETAVAVVSKSGGTIETIAQYIFVRQWLREKLGENWAKHLLMITDQQSGPLRAEATHYGAASLPVPDFLGGRYSVFSAVGMFPAAFLGIDYQALLAGATAVSRSILEEPEKIGQSPAFKMAVWACELLRHNYSQLLFFSYIPAWRYLGDWFAQLWAESLGKNGKGSMPIPVVGVTDQHSTCQMFLDGPRDKGCLFISCQNQERGPLFPPNPPEQFSFLRNKHFGDLLQAECLGTRMALIKNQVPLLHIQLAAEREENAGKLMQTAMLATVLCGWLLEINPLDQPAVELGKRLANARLGAQGYAAEKEALDTFLAQENKPGQTEAF